MKELKKCPFCGSDAEVVNCGFNVYFVRCTHCSINQDKLFSQKCDAIKEWNKRKGIDSYIAKELADAFNDGYEQGKNDVSKIGEWVQSEVPSMDECSLCGNHKMRYQDFVKDRYCSYCGALMINGGKPNGR